MAFGSMSSGLLSFGVLSFGLMSCVLYCRCTFGVLTRCCPGAGGLLAVYAPPDELPLAGPAPLPGGVGGPAPGALTLAAPCPELNLVMITAGHPGHLLQPGS